MTQCVSLQKAAHTRQAKQQAETTAAAATAEAQQQAAQAQQAKQQAESMAAAATADAAKAIEEQKAAQQQASMLAVEKRLVQAKLDTALQLNAVLEKVYLLVARVTPYAMYFFLCPCEYSDVQCKADRPQHGLSRVKHGCLLWCGAHAACSITCNAVA